MRPEFQTILQSMEPVTPESEKRAKFQRAMLWRDAWLIAGLLAILAVAAACF